MKQFMKRSVAVLIALVLVLSWVPSTIFTASAASYTYNWGTRGVLAAELSDTAEAWYAKYNVTYESLSALSGSSSTSSVPSSALYTELKSLMTTAHTTKTSYDGTKDKYQYTDCQNGGGAISSFYSGKAIGPAWGVGGWNREHTWPNSKGLGGSDENDIMMLRPTATSENSSRGNTAYGQSSGYYNPNSESNGKYDLRGDVARIVLYVYVRWGNTTYMWGKSGVIESKEVLLQWMEEDPVDTWELGRNDSVQSITGTRNVFVDYPELAFIMFGEEVPAGYDSPSGSGAASAHTITAQSSNTDYGTVSLSGKTITAYPYEGYQVSGYQVTSGTATVARNGNVFTVSASSDCTVQILFAPRTQSTVTFLDRGITQSTQTVYTDDVITLPAYTAAAPDGYAFRGWVTQQVAESETKPVAYKAESSYTVTGNTTFYALYAKMGEGAAVEPVYTLVTDAAQLTEGASVVISTYDSNAVAMKSTGGANNRYSGNITKNEDDTISFADDVPIDILTLKAGAGSGTYAFYSVANGQYLAAAATGNVLQLQNNVDANASFTVAIDADGKATVISQTTNSANSLQYNSSANVFACYSSGQKAISLYVSAGADLYYTTNPVTCAHSNTTNVAEAAATCTENGYTAGVFCNDCQTYISGHEVLEAPGHSMDDGIVTTKPTCTETGIKTYTCTACGATKTEDVPAPGHSMDDGTVTTKPTCTKTGIKTYTCTVCGATETEDVPAPGHNYVQNGDTYTCSACGDSYTKAANRYYIATKRSDTGNYYFMTSTLTGTGTKLRYQAVDSGLTKLPDAITAPDEGKVFVLVDNGDGTYGIYAEGVAGANYLGHDGGNYGVLVEEASALKLTVDVTDGVYNIHYARTDTEERYLALNSTASNNYFAWYTGQSKDLVLIPIVEEKPEEPGLVDQWKVVLQDNLNANFHLNLNTGDQVKVTVGTEETIYDASALEQTENGKYVVTVSLAAAQMMDSVTIQVVGKESEAPVTYTIRQYAEEILADDTKSAYHALVKEMLNYGARAQQKFGYNTENLANAGITDVESQAVPASNAIAEMTHTCTLTGLEFYAASLVYREKVAVRFYFKPTAAFTEDYLANCLFTVNGEACTPEKNGNYYCIEVAGISPNMLDNPITIEVADETGDAKVVYSPLNYITRMNEKFTEGSNEQNLMKALYNYYLAAKAYVESN